jgi:hypothetical protein
MQTISPVPPTVTPSPTVDTPTDTPTVPLNNTTPGKTLGDNSGAITEPIPASKAGSSLGSFNAGVALTSREAIFFMVLPGVVATSLMF